MSTVITDADAKKHIGHNVSRFLEAKGWSQKQLADETKENEMTISRVVRGMHVPGAGLLARIAEKLDVTPNDLLASPSPPKKFRRTVNST